MSKNFTMNVLNPSSMGWEKGDDAHVERGPFLRLLHAGLVTVLVILAAQPVAGGPTDPTPAAPVVTEILLRGVVKAKEDGVVLPGVNVYLKGGVVGTVTDSDGKFEFPQKLKEGDVVYFSYVGFVTWEYTVPKSEIAVIELNVALELQTTLGEVAGEQVYASKASGLKGLWKKVKSVF